MGVGGGWDREWRWVGKKAIPKKVEPNGTKANGTKPNPERNGTEPRTKLSRVKRPIKTYPKTYFASVDSWSQLLLLKNTNIFILIVSHATNPPAG